MSLLLYSAILTAAIPVSIYLIYIVAVIFTKENSGNKVENPPDITIVIPTYNEEKVIEHRIKNLRDINYPADKIHAIVVDDRSSDNTVEFAKGAFDKYNVSGEVIVKDSRTGTNESVNLGVKSAKTDFVVTTDADVVFEDDAIDYAIGTLLNDDNIGAVCGELEPIVKEKSFTTGSEKAYRSVYGKMCTWESHVHSTYCFNGPLIALKKKAFSPIPATHGASDAGMALEIIRNGYRCIYEVNAKFYEYITENLTQQRRQKIRRSSRLQEATLHNINLISSKYGKFGTLIFPMRFLMFFVVPVTFFVSVILWSLFLAQFNILFGLVIVAGFAGALISGLWSSNILSSFIWHQVYLLFSLRYMFKGKHIWQAIDREKV
ncbi:glycosyltransferase [Methanohalobium sp.]|uniref:glycosyltransferase n=1 Tax=Methanohalobium sp. TaxID=2837493 RepID=UPI0025F414BE|nr:glycosyltransferase [Methanohalobium sp.]